MESVERKRKKKKGVKGDGDDENDCYIGGKKGNADGGALSSETDFQIVDNIEGEKKRKKKKEKRRKEERDECVVSDQFGGDGGALSSETDFRIVDNMEGEKKRKKKKEKRRKEERDECVVSDQFGGDDGGDGNVGEMENGGHVVQKPKKNELFGVHGELKKKKKKKKEKRSGKERKREKNLEKMRISDSDCGAGDDIEKEPRKKKRKREKERVMDDSTGVIVTGENLDKEVLEDVGKKKRKTGNGKNKKLANDLVSCEGSSTIGIEKDDEINTKYKGKDKPIKQAENTKAKKSKKKVSFSGQVEVFPVPCDSNNQEDKLIQAKRFSAEEDETIREAVHNYIKDHGLGEEGLNMVLNCKSQPEVKGCWKVIAEAIPYRPYKSIYNRAHILFERGERQKWSEEEIELLRKYNAEHGNKWKVISEELGRHRRDVKDAWRRLRVTDKLKGRWSQTEYQTLFDLVNSDLRLKIIEQEEKKRKHGMLRDNIHWTAVSDSLKTRTGPNCSQKWYSQLQSPMVAQGIWADIDDNRLIDVLYNLDATCVEDVDWDNLLDHRSGDICRNRWNQMALHIGKSKSFSEQVEMLTRRYCPDLIEVRELWQNKPYVD